MKKYNSFLGAFFSGDNGQGGYNAAYEKKSLANLYGGQLAPEQEQEALAGLSRVNPEAAGKWQQETVKQSAQLLLALGKDNPVAQQAWQTRIKPNLSRMYGAQAASLPDQIDDNIMAVAQQIAGTSQGALPSDVQSFDYFTQGMTAEEKEKARRIRVGLDQKVGAEGIKYLPNGGAAYEDPVTKKIYMINPGETTWREFSYPNATSTQAPKQRDWASGDKPQSLEEIQDWYRFWQGKGMPKEQLDKGADQLALSIEYTKDFRVDGAPQPAPVQQTAPQPVTTGGQGAAWADTSKKKESKTVVRLTPEEVAAEGLPVGTIAQRDETTGSISILDKPAKSASFSDTNTLRDDYNKAIAQPMAMMDAYEKMRQAYKNPSPAGDIALVYAYMKILDPTSVVREAEFETAVKAGSVPDTISNMFYKAKSGELLTENRQDFLMQGAKLYAGAKQKYNQVKQNYKQIAERNGVNVDDVIVDGHIPVSQKFPAQGGRKYSVGQTLNINGKRYKVTGGDLNSDPDLEEMP